MAGAQYLKRRASGIYFVRLCVPARLKAAVGKGEVHRSTGSRHLRVAKIVAAKLSAQWHRSLEKLSRMDVEKVVAGSVDLLGEGLLPIETAAEVLGGTPLDLARQLVSQEGAQFFVEARDWDGWLLEDVWKLDHEHDELSGATSVDITEQRLIAQGERRRLSQTLTIRFPEEAVASLAVPGSSVAQFLLPRSRDKAFITPFPGTPLRAVDILVQRADVERLRAQLAANVPSEMVEQARGERTHRVAHDHGLANPRYASRTVASVTETFLERKVPSWKRSTRSINEEAVGLLTDLAGECQLYQVDREWLVGLTAHLRRLPDHRNLVRQKLHVGARCADLVAFAEQHNGPRATPSAVTKILAVWGAVFKWAVDQGYLVKNPATGLNKELLESMGIRADLKKTEERSAFSDAELQLIFSASFFACGVGERTAEGKFYSYRPHYYWLPLLALHMGGRLNELAQLHLSDIRTSESGITYVDFNLDDHDKMDVDGLDSEGRAGSKSLKTVNARRQVPVHPCLIDLGFLDYVEALRANSHMRLFPELQFDPVKGYGKAVSKWFNDRFLGRELGIERNGKRTFHSFRHNFATAAGNTGMHDRVRDQLMGHARGEKQSEGGTRYDKGRTIEMLHEHIARVNYKLPAIGRFDAAAGVEAVRHAMELKSSRKGRRARA